MPYLALPNATPVGAAFHVVESFCEVPASRDAQVDTQLLRHIQAGHLLSDSKSHTTILIAGRCGRLQTFRPLCCFSDHLTTALNFSSTLHARMHSHTHARMHICMHTNTCTPPRVHAYVHQTHTYARMYTCTHAYPHARTNLRLHACDPRGIAYESVL